MDDAVVAAIDRNGSATATLTITVTAVNDAPVAGPDSFATGFEALLTVAATTLLANDTDVDSAALTVTDVGSAVHGDVVRSGSDIGFTRSAGIRARPPSATRSPMES